MCWLLDAPPLTVQTQVQSALIKPQVFVCSSCAGVELESQGGSVQLVRTAAPSGVGLVELEEALLLQVFLRRFRQQPLPLPSPFRSPSPTAPAGVGHVELEEAHLSRVVPHEGCQGLSPPSRTCSSMRTP